MLEVVHLLIPKKNLVLKYIKMLFVELLGDRIFFKMLKLINFCIKLNFYMLQVICT